MAWWEGCQGAWRRSLSLDPQAFLNGSEAQVYHSQQVGPPGSAISPDLLLDASGHHLYVLTPQQVSTALGGGQSTLPGGLQYTVLVPGHCAGGPHPGGCLSPIRRLQQLPAGPGPAMRLVCPPGQVSCSAPWPTLPACPFPPPPLPAALQSDHPPQPLAAGVSGCRCTRKEQCRRAVQPQQWLWSREQEGGCPHIQDQQPAHRPRQEQGQVRPRLWGWEGRAPPPCAPLSPSPLAPGHLVCGPAA